jgi:hypothetical protein
MPVSQPPPKLVGGLHIPKYNVTNLYNTYLDVFWRYISIPVQWTHGFRLGEFEANLLWLLPRPWRSGRGIESHDKRSVILFFHVILPIWIIIYHQIPFSTSSNISVSRRIPCRKILIGQFMLSACQHHSCNDYFHDSTHASPVRRPSTSSFKKFSSLSISIQRVRVLQARCSRPLF